MERKQQTEKLAMYKSIWIYYIINEFDFSRSYKFTIVVQIRCYKKILQNITLDIYKNDITSLMTYTNKQIYNKIIKE